MRTLIAIPPLTKLSGGLRVLYDLGRFLHESGREVLLCPEEAATPGIKESGLPVLGGGWQKAELKPTDLWLTPEGWPNALFPGLRAGARTVVYVQNWSFFFSALPPGLHLHSLPLEFIAVSHPVAWFIKQVTGKEALVLRPGIDLELFRPGNGTAAGNRAASSNGPASGNGAVSGPGAEIAVKFAPKKSLAGTAKRVRIGWMPRKNKALALQTRQILEARLAVKGSAPAEWPEWVEINGRSPAEVAALLASCQIFLATGFPEGCPLPPLEAMACGCLVVGFHGLGGLDYLRPYTPTEERKKRLVRVDHADHIGLAGHAWPPLPLLFEPRPVPWGANALVAPDHDTPALALYLEAALELARENGPEYHALTEQAALTAQHYSLAEQKRATLELWDRNIGQKI